ncbi:MAG: 6,7-dimethyl-8-ribityllumazine synthase [Ktedonobacteraceae bacterium]
MQQTIELLPPVPELDGSALKIGVVVARYNWPITGALLQLAQETLQRLAVAVEDIHVLHVPGSYELATAASAMLSREKYDALICFGCVMKGETRHDVVVSDAAAQGIQRVALDTGIPIIFGVLCVENLQQAEERIIRGKECAEAAIEMARTVQSLRKRRGEPQCSQELLKK